MLTIRLRAWAVVVTCALLSSCRGAAPAAPTTALTLDSLAALRGGDVAPTLARPSLVSVDTRGRIYIQDRSDRDVKVYDASGRALRTIGRSGTGPGEFASLQSAQIYRDSVVAYDFAQGRVSVFAPNGRFARAWNPAPLPWQVRVVDDSLLLLIGHPARGGALLRLSRMDGTVLSTFFDVANHFGDPPLRQHEALFADARNGVVFAGFFGGDSLFAFDYGGHSLAAGPIDPAAPLPSLQRLVQQNRGALRRADGTWVQDGARALINVIALDRGRAALHVTTYDAKLGSDPIEGGTLIVVEVSGGRIAVTKRSAIGAGPLGLDRSGDLLFLKYSGGAGQGYVLERAVALGSS